MPNLRWKGELGDGHIHMTSAEYCEHKAQESDEKNKQMLRKLSNNPILTEEARAAIRYAVYRLDDNIWMRKRIYELQEQCKNAMKARNETIENTLYNGNQVAEIIAEIVGDDCACNVNGNDEWLPYHCDFRDSCCPNPVGVACWEQYLKYKDKRDESEEIKHESI